MLFRFGLGNLLPSHGIPKAPTSETFLIGST